MKLSNLKIIYKLMLVVGAMAAVIAAVSLMGVTSVRQLTENTREVDVSGNEALDGARLNQNVARLMRDEFMVASDPSAETIKEVSAAIAAEAKQLEERIAELHKNADPTQKELLVGIDKAYQAYKPLLSSMLDLARKHSAEVKKDEAREIITTEALKDRTFAAKLREATSKYNDYSEHKAEEIAKSADDEGMQAQTLMMAIAGIGLIGGVILGYLLGSSGIVKPMARSVESLNKLAAGDLNADIFGLGRKDEIGDVAKGLEVFKANAVEKQRLDAEAATEQKKRQARADAVEKLTSGFDSTMSSVLKTVASAATELQATATSMTSTAEETSRQASAVAAASEETTTNVQTVAAATEEMSSSVGEIGRQVSQSTEIAKRAVSEAEKTNAEVQGLAEAASKIGEVVNLISDIAEQTNLLALNATIEAARAGEAGKGFAVVASEVKTLASQTAKATEEIATQIGAIQGAVTGSVEAIKGIGKTIAEISEIATTIASAVEEQGAATQEISRNVQEAAQGTSAVTENISGVNQAAGETGAAAGQVLSAAQELSRQSETLRTEVERFLVDVKAA
jgi:methyl-accepting chemotaxis protein